jgi:hypothetical protein
MSCAHPAVYLAKDQRDGRAYRNPRQVVQRRRQYPDLRDAPGEPDRTKGDPAPIVKRVENGRSRDFPSGGQEDRFGAVDRDPIGAVMARPCCRKEFISGAHTRHPAVTNQIRFVAYLDRFVATFDPLSDSPAAGRVPYRHAAGLLRVKVNGSGGLSPC